MYYHRTKSGEEIKLSKLAFSHLVNIIALIRHRAYEGITVYYGGGSSADDDIWMDSVFLQGDDAEEYLNLDLYLDELKRRRRK